MKFKIGDKVLRNKQSEIWIGRTRVQDGMFSIVGTIIEFTYSITNGLKSPWIEIQYVRVEWTDGQIYSYEVDSDELIIINEPSEILKDLL